MMGFLLCQSDSEFIAKHRIKIKLRQSVTKFGYLMNKLGYRAGFLIFQDHFN